MSKEQLTDHAQVGTVARDTAGPDQTHGLPPHVYAQVTALGPGDAAALAELLTLYAGLTPRILAVAAPQMGNAAVQRAIAQSKSKAQGKPGALSQGELHEMLDDAPAPAAKTQGKPGTLSQAEMHEMLDDKPAAKTQGKPGALSQAELHEMLDDEPAKAAGEPAWVGGARKYNDAHAELVADFNDATGNSCLDASGRLDPQAVRRWQAAHGLGADGKVGPHTLAAARQASAKAGPANVAADQRVPV